MNMYEAIYNRKSIRNYRQDKISDAVLDQIARYQHELMTLSKEIACHIEIINNMQDSYSIKGIWKVKAPYYMIFYSEEREGYLKNAGYMLEQMILYLTAKGIGTCYLGSSKIGITEMCNKKQVMVVAFGYPDGKLYREAAFAKRLPLKELCIFKEEPSSDIRTILKAARLAPSSFNGQPWRFVVYNSRIHIFTRKELFIGPFVPSLQEFNIGLALCHMMISAEELWLDASLTASNQFNEKIFKNNEYVISLVLK